MLISIVIPVFNSEKTIIPLCRSIVAELGGTCALDIVLVNDNSSDDSERACLKVQAEFSGSITYLRLSRNFGEHNAVMAGLHHTRGEYVVTMDDDLQNDPAEIHKLLAEIDKGYDIVYARFATSTYHWARRLASRIHGFLVGALLHKPDTSSLSTFRAMNRFLRDEIIKYQGPMPYIDAIILRVTSAIGAVVVRHHPRQAGRSNYTLSKLTVLWGNAVVSYSLIPLRIIGAMGLLLIVMAFARSGWLVLDFINPLADDPTEYERLAALIVFFRGLQLVATAIVGEYVGRVLLYVNRDPQFVVRAMSPALPADKDATGRPPVRR